MGRGPKGVRTDRLSLPKGVKSATIEGEIHIYASITEGGTVHPDRRRKNAYIDVFSHKFTLQGDPVRAHALVDLNVFERLRPGKVRRAILHLARDSRGNVVITHVQVGSDTVPVMPFTTTTPTPPE